MPGPPPKKGARRANLRADWIILPASGRSGRAPKWPIGSRAPRGVGLVWRELWKTPQAVAWERLGWTRVVARYAKDLVDAEKPGAVVTLKAEIRQLEDRLGLSPMAMKRLQWEVGEAPAEEQESDPDVPKLSDYRDRAG